MTSRQAQVLCYTGFALSVKEHENDVVRPSVAHDASTAEEREGHIAGTGERDDEERGRQARN